MKQKKRREKKVKENKTKTEIMIKIYHALFTIHNALYIHVYIDIIRRRKKHTNCFLILNQFFPFSSISIKSSLKIKLIRFLQFSKEIKF